MAFKIPRILRLRKIKLSTWIQFLLIVGIVGAVCVVHGNRFSLESSNFKSQRDNSAPCVKKTSSSNDCLIDSAASRVVTSSGSEDGHVFIANSKGIHSEKNDNESEKEDIKRKDNAEATTKGNEDINAIVKAYFVHNNKSTEEVNKPGSALYSEIPPAYDELLKVVMDTRERCLDASDYEAIIAVHTAPNNFENRKAFRWLYGDFTKTNPYHFKLVFFIGLVTDSKLQDLLKKENEEYGDTVQGNFLDAYINMTYKAIMVFNWLDTHCHGIKGLFRVDDDVFMNLQKVYPRWSYVQRRNRMTKTIACQRFNKDRVMRTGKWAVPDSLIPGSKYNFMRCPGYFAAITVDLIHDMNVQAQKAPFFWIDDIVMLGLVPHSIGGVVFYPFNKWMANPKVSDDFYRCIERDGPQCSYWVGITDVQNFQKLYGYVTGSIPTVNKDNNEIVTF